MTLQRCALVFEVELFIRGKEGREARLFVNLLTKARRRGIGAVAWRVYLYVGGKLSMASEKPNSTRWAVISRES